MKTFKEFVKEDGPVTTTSGGVAPGAGAYASNVQGSDSILGVVRRKPPHTFAGKAMYRVSSDDYNKAIHGKKKFKRYKSYVGGKIGEEIREYAKQNRNAAIIVQDELTGAMYYLKHGKR